MGFLISMVLTTVYLAFEAPASCGYPMLYHTKEGHVLVKITSVLSEVAPGVLATKLHDLHHMWGK